MSLRDDKKNILNKIGAFSALRENMNSKEPTNSMASISNKKDVIPFLLDTLKTMIGIEALRSVTGEIIGNFIDKTETNVKKTLKNQLTQFNSDDSLPTNFVNDGIDIKIKKIDVEGKLKLKPTSDFGALMYKTASFDSITHDAILNAGTPINYQNNIFITYNKITDTINIKPYENISIGEFFGDYIDKSNIINKQEIVTKALNAIYGNVDGTQNKTLNEIIAEQKLNKMLNKIIDGENNEDLTPNELIEIEQKAKDIFDNNLVHYMGCGYVTTTIDDADLVNTVNSVCDSADANYIANVIESNLNNDVANSDSAAVKENKDTVKDGYFNKLIKELVLAMVKSATASPQIMMLINLSKTFQNEVVAVDEGIDYVKNNAIFIKCLIIDLIKQLAEFIFKMAVEQLIALLKPIILKIAKEKIKQYSDIIKSLILKI